MNKFVLSSLCLLPMVCQARDVRLSSNVPAELSENGKIVGKMPLVVSVNNRANYEIIIKGQKYHLDLVHQRGRSGGLTSTTTEESTCAPIAEGLSTSFRSSTRGTTTSFASSSEDEAEKKEEEVVALQYTPTDYYINVSANKMDLKVKKFVLTQYGDLKFGDAHSLMTLSEMTKMPQQKISKLLNQTVSADEAATLMGK